MVNWMRITHMGTGMDTAATIVQEVLVQFRTMIATPTITILRMALVMGSAITVTGHRTVIMAITTIV